MKKFITIFAISSVLNCLNAQALQQQELNFPKTDNSVIQTSGTAKIDNLDSNEKKQENSKDDELLISLFPNPCNEEFNIQLSSKIREGQISIFNQNGQLCKVFMINQVDHFSFDHGLQSGFYILILRVKNKMEHLHFKVN